MNVTAAAVLSRPARRLTLAASRIREADNDRTEYDARELKELADSIANVGLQVPPKVRPVAADLLGRDLELVYGHRRFRAMTEVLGWTDVEVDVDELDDGAAADAMLAENLNRVDLDPIDEGRAWQKRMSAEDPPLTYAEVAKRFGVSWNRVEAKVRLLRLVPEAQMLVRTGRLSESAAWAVDVLDPNRQMLAVSAFYRGDVDSASLRALCSRLLGEQQQEKLFEPESFLQLESYVADAKANRKLSKPERMRRLLSAMAAELGDQHPLAVAARDLLAESSK